MEKTGLTVGEMLSIGGVIVGIVIWLVRLEGKVKQTEEDFDCHVKDDFEGLEKDFYAHEKNENIHHNAKAFDEFKTSINDKFQTMGRSVEKVGTQMENGLKDLSRKIEDFIDKRR